jgi:hypothetical protein
MQYIRTCLVIIVNVMVTPSHSGGPGFKSWPRDWLLCEVFYSFPQSVEANTRVEP